MAPAPHPGTGRWPAHEAPCSAGPVVPHPDGTEHPCARGPHSVPGHPSWLGSPSVWASTPRTSPGEGPAASAVCAVHPAGDTQEGGRVLLSGPRTFLMGIPAGGAEEGLGGSGPERARPAGAGGRRSPGCWGGSTVCQVGWGGRACDLGGQEKAVRGVTGPHAWSLSVSFCQ